MLQTLWDDEEGLTTVEYAILLVLVSISAFTAWTALGSRSVPAVTNATRPLPTN